MTVPVLLIERHAVPTEALALLRERRDARVLLERELGAAARAVALHTARMTIVATLADPMTELVFIRTSGFTGPLAFAIDRRFMTESDDLRDADVRLVLPLPLTPASVDELIRVAAASPDAPVAFAPADLVLDAVSRTARQGANAVRLSQREFALLHCLVAAGGRPVPLHEIHAYVWADEHERSAAREIIQVTVSQLRKKLRRIDREEAIVTYRDFGYGLAPTMDGGS